MNIFPTRFDQEDSDQDVNSRRQNGHARPENQLRTDSDTKVSSGEFSQNTEAAGVPILSNEAQRLRALKRYAILDTLPEQAYEDVVFLASQICQVPIAMVTFIDNDRQWFKARKGMPLSETKREHAFCAHAIAMPDTFVVPDATQDERFVRNPLVVGDPNIRFYAGAPLVTPEGQALGTVCVIDREPRELSAQQLKALQALSRQVMTQLELRVRMREMDETQQLFRVFADNTPMLAYIKSEDGCYEFANVPFLKRFNLTSEQVVGHYDTELWSPEVVERIRASEQKVMATGRSSVTLETTQALDGSQVYWQVYKFSLLWNTQRSIGSIAVDVSESKHYEQKLEEIRGQLEARNAILHELSTTDELTGAHNRRSFVACLRIEWERSARLKAPLSLLMIDVDHFKAYNDSFGHPAGDQALQQLAQLLRQTARTVDIVSRYGGEEFSVILPDADAAGARIFAERFRQVIENAAWPRRDLTVSIGVATRTPQTQDAGTLLDHADRALYLAKQNGRNRVEIVQ